MDIHTFRGDWKAPVITLGTQIKTRPCAVCNWTHNGRPFCLICRCVVQRPPNDPPRPPAPCCNRFDVSTRSFDVSTRSFLSDERLPCMASPLLLYVYCTGDGDTAGVSRVSTGTQIPATVVSPRRYRVPPARHHGRRPRPPAHRSPPDSRRAAGHVYRPLRDGRSIRTPAS